ncbi:saccharopine dehydrogenase NADP-binding domain-containing protein [Fluviicola sp.]|uniref:saccharopine dehydrogenase family protein n=1 Tax=Fluviicola sp. TaxID=1917219 RepID=UPI002822EECB|nr:saccharopine dehydrogenase NADP-binding domain-containing protein [Fluviicola sp.]MDR0802633.1 saccharopine dehydrogenase NADP-binding domain-containing protein [Fluviicola sp.]
MKRILLLGAGLSASTLIRYLLGHAEAYNWQLRVVDQSLDLVKSKLAGHPCGVALSFNALDRNERWEELKHADLVISMLPARFHPEVAKDCLELKKNLITPSYVSPEMKELGAWVRDAGLIFMNEIGVDPGIDHMSAMRVIDSIKSQGGTISGFKSYCGGLMAPESDTNPWNYKFTWNPRNVILAAQGGTARYIDQHQYKYIPYTQVFSRLDEIVVDGYGEFEGYANRDSLSYRAIYGLEDIPTMYRATLRKSGFCQAWNVFVQLGLTDDSFVLQHSENLTPRTFVNAFLPFDESLSVEEKWKKACEQLGVTDMYRFEWLGLFDSSEKIGLKDATPAQILEKILAEKWVLEPEDKDMLVMVHQFSYLLEGKQHFIESSMVNIGDDPVHTAMSKTVGYPVGICAKLILEGKISQRGVLLPTKPEIYNPILEELETLGVVFHELEKMI